MNAAELSSRVAGSEADRYRMILDRKIREGAASAAGLIEKIHTDMPKDQVVSTRAAKFFFGTAARIGVEFGGEVHTITDHALGQVAERASVPITYLRELAGAGKVWQSDLACEILNRSYGNIDRQRVLARSVRGQLRGWLSDKFRRLDSRPLVDALAKECQAIGAVPVDGVATETRVALKVLLPEVIEPVPGEFLAYGGEWSNSDYGNGYHSFRTFILRVWCLNGATAEDLLKQVHLGAKLPENIEFSDRTLRLDTQASVSALQDIVRGALGPAGRDRLTAAVRKAQERELAPAQLKATLSKAVGKELGKTIVDAYEGADVVNLPEGRTAWRASNAISWVARNTQDPERRLDLERLAGSVIN